MQEVKKIIATHQRALRSHPLFALLEGADTIDPLASLARGCAFWPMVFQDVLRLNLERASGTELERHARQHRAEDAGHEQWFLEDLRTFDVGEPRLEELFSEEYRPLRDASYALVSEVLGPLDGRLRVVFLLTVEAAGHVFFEEMARAVERLCPELPLRYFSHSHLGVEKEHDLFAESTDVELDEIVFGKRELAMADELVGKVCRTFAGIFDHYAARAMQTVPRVSDVHRLGETGGAPEVRRAHGS